MRSERERLLALTAVLVGVGVGGCVVTVNDTSGGTQGTSSTTAATGTGTGTGSTGASTGATSGGPTSGSTGVTGTTGAPQLDCCLVNLYPGCLDDTIEACVCALDAYCCGKDGGTWDLTCVNLVNAGCGLCDVETTAGSSGWETTGGSGTAGTGGTVGTGGSSTFG